MSTSIFFDLKLRDFTKRTFDDIKNRAGMTFGAINKDIERTNKTIAAMGGGRGSGIAAGGISGIGLGALGAGLYGAGMVKNFMTSSIKAAMDFGMQQKSFEVLTGNAGIGRGLAGDLRDLKQSTIMGPSVYKNAQTMMGFGIGHGEVVKDLKMIGDIAMGDVDRMGALTLAFSQTRAAGKLMGQDLLQYVNAGFNPLAVMSEKWKEVGLHSKKTVGELRDMMSSGGISSALVTKAFELATSKGGMFYNMMEQIGDTAGGKMKKLQGTWAATKIDVGNAVLPLAGDLMSLANSTLHWLKISKTAPEVLFGERAEAGMLVGAIGKLNQGSELRAGLIDKLTGKYPDYFAGLDREKAGIDQLRSSLDKLNSAYDRKIGIAQSKLISSTALEEAKGLRDLGIKAYTQAQDKQLGKYGMFSMQNFKYLSFFDRFRMNRAGVGIYDESPKGLRDWADRALARSGELMGVSSAADYKAKAQGILDLIGDANKLWGIPGLQSQTWGDDAKKMLPGLVKELTAWNKVLAKSHGKISGDVLGYDYSKLEGLVHYSKNGGAAGGTADAAMTAMSDAIIKGGQKQIVINLNHALIGEQKFSVSSMREALSVSLSEQEKALVKMLEGAANSL